MSGESDKTEEPTPQRLKKARQDGDSGASSVLSQSFAFLVAVSFAASAVTALVTSAKGDLQRAIASAASVRFAAGVRPDVVFEPLASAGAEFLRLVIPLLAAVAAAGALGSLAQTGGVTAMGRLAPKFERLDPFAGLKGLFSFSRVFAVLRSLFAATLAGFFAYDGLRRYAVDVAHLTGRARLATAVVATVAGGLAWRVAFVGLVLGTLDALVTRTMWRRRLRMSKDEVRREHRDSEGDPHLKAARARVHSEMLAQATIANVRTASVVVVNPTHLACALRYREAGEGEAEGDEAPVVLANGEGEFAERIVRAAHQYAVPVLKDVPLAHALKELQTGDVIPEALYEAVAEILGALATRSPGDAHGSGSASPVRRP